MRISFSTLPGNLIVTIGYGYAGFNMVRALQRLGHTVPFQDPDCKVQIHFSQPDFYEFNPGQYRIGYTPWESTGMPDGWVRRFNELDELWTPSPLIAQWYADAGVKKDIRVYEHGVNSNWTSVHRKPQTKIKFLHVGEPAPRKGGDMTFKAFRAAFGDRTDVQLTIKSNGPSTIRDRSHYGRVMQPGDFSNVRLITSTLPEEQLVSLFHEHHALVYPGWGEGFGLIPLQAMASGMPIICTEAWAPYARFIPEPLRLGSTLVNSPWPDMHPGQMFKPDFDQLVEQMLYVADNFDQLARESYIRSFKIKREYDWDYLTKNAFEHVVKKFDSDHVEEVLV